MLIPFSPSNNTINSNKKDDNNNDKPNNIKDKNIDNNKSPWKEKEEKTIMKGNTIVYWNILLLFWMIIMTMMKEHLF